MKKDLYITSIEKALLNIDKVNKIYNLVEINLDYEDDLSKFKARLSLFNPVNKEFKTFLKKLKKSPSKVNSYIKEINFNNLSDQDIKELTYLLGPNLIYRIMKSIITSSSKELQNLCFGLSHLRMTLFSKGVSL